MEILNKENAKVCPLNSTTLNKNETPPTCENPRSTTERIESLCENSEKSGTGEKKIMESTRPWNHKDLSGQRFGKLFVIRDSLKRNENHNIYWLCRCDCGNEKEITGCNLRNKTQDCSCVKSFTQNLTGRKFEKLLVIEPAAKKDKHNHARWLCKCDCGNFVEVYAYHLKSKTQPTKSCGCLLGNKKDITNRTFGILKAIKPLFINKNRAVVWLCECGCGEKRQISASSLLTGNSKSCGCVNNKYSEPGESAFNILYNSYKRKAEKRKIDFALTKDEFRYFTKQNCHYCNCLPLQEFDNGNCSQLKASYFYNGIDRKNNKEGYLRGNCLSCCGRCNRAKMTLRYGDFLDFIKKTYENLHLENFRFNEIC